MKKNTMIKILEPFAEQAKFVSSEGPGYLRKQDWVDLRKLYSFLKDKDKEE